MLRLRYLGNMFQKRTLRPKYAQYQGYPYAATLDPSYLGENEESGDPDFFKDVYTFPANIYTFQNGLIPGLVMTRSAGENVVVASGTASVKETAFGLLAQFVGGNLDELGGDPYVGVWRGVDSTYVLLAPAFNPEGLAAKVAAAKTGEPVLLYCGSDGRLTCERPQTESQVIAHVINYVSPSILEIDLKI